jgi:hypothetical protein
MMTYTKTAAPFYYNVNWDFNKTSIGGGQYSYTYKTNGAQANPASIDGAPAGPITIPAGTPIKYRYTLNQSGTTTVFAAVYSHDYGWGFVPVSSLRSTPSGWYSSDNGETEYQCTNLGSGWNPITWPHAPDDDLGPKSDYLVYRYGSQAESVSVPQVAQQFKTLASAQYLRSASMNIGSSPGGTVQISVYRDAGQTSLVATKTVTVQPFGETTAVFDSPVAINHDQTYYLQAYAPGGGNLQVFRSIYNDEPSGGAQYNWDAGGFSGLDINGRVVTSTDNTPEHYNVYRGGIQADVSGGFSQVAQKFVAKTSQITSVSARLGNLASGQYALSVYSDAAQTQLVGTKTVPVNSGGMTTATFDTPLNVTAGSTYYFQVVATTGAQFVVIRSGDDAYPAGGTQYNWGAFGATYDLLARITG